MFPDLFHDAFRIALVAIVVPKLPKAAVHQSAHVAIKYVPPPLSALTG
jgi:hypothetical protein